MADQPTINPYAPPAASIETPPAGAAENRFDRPLFSPRQIAVATFFGSLLSGILLLQANFRVMRRSRDANKTLVLGLLATVAVIALLSALPGMRISTPINIALAFGMSKLADSLQGQAFFKHTIAGGAKRSGWLVFAVIVGTVVVLIAALLGILFALGGPRFGD